MAWKFKCATFLVIFKQCGCCCMAKTTSQYISVTIQARKRNQIHKSSTNCHTYIFFSKHHKNQENVLKNKLEFIIRRSIKFIGENQKGYNLQNFLLLLVKDRDLWDQIISTLSTQKSRFSYFIVAKICGNKSLSGLQFLASKKLSRFL